MGNRVSGYTQTYQTVRITMEHSASSLMKENRANRLELNKQPNLMRLFPLEQTHWAIESPQPQKKQMQSEPLQFALERTRQGSGHNKPKTSVKSAEQHKQKITKLPQLPPPKRKPKMQKPVVHTNASEYEQPNLHTKRTLILLVVVVVALLAVISVLLVIRQYMVIGVSMEPTLMEGDKLYYTSFQDVSYGDIVIFDTGDAYGLVVKRVVGLPGDVIQVNADGTVVRNLALIDEPYIQPDALHNSGMASVTVQDGMAFLIGDNRAESIDSRDIRIGQIPIDSICGEVRLVVRGVG